MQTAIRKLSTNIQTENVIPQIRSRPATVVVITPVVDVKILRTISIARIVLAVNQTDILLPSDLRAVLKPITKYTDNVGGGSGSVQSNVTATTDYLPLLSMKEVFGSTQGIANVKILRTISIARIVLAVNQTDILAARLRRFEPLEMDFI